MKFIYVDYIFEKGDKEDDNAETKGHLFAERLARLEFEDIDQYTYNHTFKLYQDTTFDDIK